MRPQLSVALVVMLAGCSQSPDPGSARQSGIVTDSNPVSSLDLQLGFLGEWDFVVLEIEPSAPTKLVVHSEEMFPTNAPLRHCQATEMPDFAVFSGDGRAEVQVVASPASRQPVVSQSLNPDGTWSFNFDLEQTLGEKPVLLALGYYEAKEWEKAGANLSVVLTAGMPFSWRIVAEGNMTCVTDPLQANSGDLIQAGFFTTARNLAFPFTLNQAGHGYLSVWASAHYEFQLVGPSGEVAHRSADAPSASEPGITLNSTAPGDYDLRVPALLGDNPEVTVIVMDLPGAVASRLASERTYSPP